MKITIKDNGGIGLKFGDRSGGTNNYEALINKPSINQVVLMGNKTGAELYLQDAMDELTEQEIDKIIYGG